MTPLVTADEEVKADACTLRARAREMARNDPVFAHVIDVVADNVIGPHGIDVQPRIYSTRGNLNESLNAQILAAWKAWTEPANCSVDGRLCFRDILAVAVETWFRDGEAFLRFAPMADNPYGIALQFIDPDQVDFSYNLLGAREQNEIRMGVEITAAGRPVAYHVITNPRTRTRVRVPADDVLHLFRTQRAGQTRGVTQFAPAMMTARHLAGYREAELVAARTAAAKQGFWVQQPEAAIDGVESDASIPMETSPGSIDKAPPGWDFKPWDPQHPTTAYPEFVKSALRDIAAGLGVTYVTLLGDLEATSYGSMRGGLLAERDRWRVMQGWVVSQVCKPIYRRWLSSAYMTGAVALPSPQIDTYAEALWFPRGWSWVDPEKDLQAAKLALELNLDTRTRIAAEQGINIEDVFAEKQREQMLAAEYGITLETPNEQGQGADAGSDAPADGDAGAGY